MKIRTILAAAVAFVALSSAPANAVGISTIYGEGGTTTGGSFSQTITSAGAFVTTSMGGLLQSKTRVDFTFAADYAPINSAFVYSSGVGTAGPVSVNATPMMTSPAANTLGLVTVMANLSGSTVGKASIINMTSGAVDIMASFMAYIVGSGSYQVSWKTTPVPLPAALPLFGLGIAALAARRSRKAKA